MKDERELRIRAREYVKSQGYTDSNIPKSIYGVIDLMVEFAKKEVK